MHGLADLSSRTFLKLLTFTYNITLVVSRELSPPFRLSKLYLHAPVQGSTRRHHYRTVPNLVAYFVVHVPLCVGLDAYYAFILARSLSPFRHGATGSWASL
jgi:hypothetical protein